jgi:hypothetical protein
MSTRQKVLALNPDSIPYGAFAHSIANNLEVKNVSQ